MRGDAISRLVTSVRALPGPDAAEPIAAPPPSGDGLDVDAAALRRRVGALLAALADRVEPALAGALRRAETAWDQVDAIAIFDGEIGAEIAAARRDAEVLRASPDEESAAAGLLAQLTLAAATGLASLVERRLATIARLQLRAGGPLMIEDRPFLDLAAALRQAARGWR